MAILECPLSNTFSSAKQRETLAAVETQLERANEIENPIERFFKREQLLELHDQLQQEYLQSDGGWE